MRSAAIGLTVIGIAVLGGPAAAAPPNKFRSTGVFVNAVFSTTEGNGECGTLGGSSILHELSVDAFKSQGTSPQAFGSATIHTIDLCSEFGDFVSPHFHLDIDVSGQAFVVNKQGDRATLMATVSGTDSNSGVEATFTINLVWTATGRPERSHLVINNHDGGFKEHFIARGSSSPANVVGTFSDGTTDFASPPLLFANIGKQVTVDIFRFP